MDKQQEPKITLAIKTSAKQRANTVSMLNKKNIYLNFQKNYKLGLNPMHMAKKATYNLLAF